MAGAQAVPVQRKRNFSIIAHIDHGKSTLADRLLELTRTITPREMQYDQILDNNPLEQERGITIKLHPITMFYQYRDGQLYKLNLIDTPGHVDFTYEVSRSLAACEGALLVVDATQGVEAQTISNLYMAIEAGLEVIPVINKIDLPSAPMMIPKVKQEIVDLLGCDEEEILLISAKEGTGVEQVLDAIVERIPAPQGDPQKPLRALIFDSYFDSYRGVVTYVRVFDGQVQAGDQIRFLATGKTYEVEEVGILQLDRIPQPSLEVGDVGYIIAGVKEIRDTKVGDTITTATGEQAEPIEGFREIKPMVFAGFYPADSEEFEHLREALEKLSLNDASLRFEPETSTALGFGFRCGFLGLLHMEIIQERLEREYEINLVTTVPNVQYRVITTGGEEVWVSNPAQMPPPGSIERIEEPFIKAQIITPAEYIGAIMKLCTDRRGEYKSMLYLSPERVELVFELPLAEIVYDFYDRLKSVTRGYASFDYEPIGYRKGDLVKLDILINGDPVDALSTIVHRSKAYEWGRRLCGKLRQIIPRQLFEVVIQAAIGSKIIARETIKPLRKNVTAKCYGGDVTRKRKLLERQKEGKKRMKQIGKVEVPQEAFLAVLSIDDNNKKG